MMKALLKHLKAHRVERSLTDTELDLASELAGALYDATPGFNGASTVFEYDGRTRILTVVLHYATERGGDAEKKEIELAMKVSRARVRSAMSRDGALSAMLFCTPRKMRVEFAITA